jgi:hypothetical protein
MLRRNLGQLRCAAMRSHAFEPFAPVGKMHAWRDVVCLRCIYCHTERYDTLNLYGEVLSRRYKYTEDRKPRRVSASEARVEFYTAYERNLNGPQDDQD